MSKSEPYMASVEVFTIIELSPANLAGGPRFWCEGYSPTEDPLMATRRDPTAYIYDILMPELHQKYPEARVVRVTVKVEVAEAARPHLVMPSSGAVN